MCSHAVAATLKQVRTLDSTTQNMLATITRLWRSLFGEVFAHQTVWIGDTANVNNLAKLFGGL
jgi:hypothetical protein